MRIFIFILMTFLLPSCSNMPDYIPPRYVVVANEILKEMEDKLSQQYHMRVISNKAGLMKNVNLLGLGFQIRGPLTQEQLRVILVGCVEAFLSAVNSNEEIRPHLKTYPYTAKGINIGIFIIDSNGRGGSDPYIGVAQAYRGTLDYKTIDRTNGHKATVSETYEEAVQILGYR